MKRLAIIARELNISPITIINFLRERGFEIRNNPSFRVSDEAYDLLVEEVQKNKTEIPKIKRLEIIGKIDLKDYMVNERQIKASQKRNNTAKYSERKDKLISLITLGEVVFFDYSKKKFGIIKDASYIGRKDNEDTINKVYVKEENLITTSTLYEGKIVVFELFNGNSGYFARNVKTLEECSSHDAEQLLSVVGESQKNALVKRIFEDDDSNEKSKKTIKTVLLKSKSINNWVLLNKYFEDDTINEFREKHLIEIENKELELYLNHAFNKALFNHFLSKYEFNGHYSFLQILQKIASNLSFNDISPTFKGLIKNLESKITVDNALSYLEILNEKIFFELAITNFSFNNIRYKDQLRKIINSEFYTQIISKKISVQLITEANQLSSDRILAIYEDFNFIESFEQFFNILNNSEFNLSNFWSIVGSKKAELSNEQIKILYDKIKKELSFEDLKRLIRKFSEKQNVIPEFFVDLFSIKHTKKQFEDLLVFLLEQNAYNNFADEFARAYSLKYVNVSNVSLITFLAKVDESQIENILSKIEVSTKQDFFQLRDFLFSNPHIFSKIQSSREKNKGLVDFLIFFQTPSESLITTDLNRFIAENLGFLQVALCKRIVQGIYLNKIDKYTSISIFDSIQWTEISALLIKAFIKLPETTQKIVLDTLNHVFKSHFEILGSKQLKPEQFLKTFTIKDIINKCDCRKSYNGEFWQGGKSSRWYISSDVPSISYGSRVTYRNNNEVVFCEGRFWKRGDFFIKGSNTKSQYRGNFYWCRGSYCAKVNDNYDLTKPYDEWTLSEIAKVLNLSTDRLVFTTLAGWANRMNEVVERLICRSCNEVLRPLSFTPKILGYNAVPVFECINQNCKNYKSSIRFTHCLNGKCNIILDSRDCESCIPNNPNHIGMKCNECGSLCPKCSGTWNIIQVEY